MGPFQDCLLLSENCVDADVDPVGRSTPDRLLDPVKAVALRLVLNVRQILFRNPHPASDFDTTRLVNSLASPMPKGLASSNDLSSFQAIGTATGAPLRARAENGTTAVLPRWLRSQSMKILPLRLALLIVAVKRSGSASESCNDRRNRTGGGQAGCASSNLKPCICWRICVASFALGVPLFLNQVRWPRLITKIPAPLWLHSNLRFNAATFSMSRLRVLCRPTELGVDSSLSDNGGLGV